MDGNSRQVMRECAAVIVDPEESQLQLYPLNGLNTFASIDDLGTGMPEAAPPPVKAPPPDMPYYNPGVNIMFKQPAAALPPVKSPPAPKVDWNLRRQQQQAAVHEHASHNEELIRVYAMFSKSDCADLQFNPDTCIRNVKSEVLRIMEERKHLMPHHESAIFVNGHHLCEYFRTLRSYNIMDGAEIFVLQRPEGDHQEAGLPDEMTVRELKSLCLEQRKEMDQLRQRQEHICQIMYGLLEKVQAVEAQLGVAVSGV